jgi:hypothetical protein
MKNISNKIELSRASAETRQIEVLSFEYKNQNHEKDSLNGKK